MPPLDQLLADLGDQLPADRRVQADDVFPEIDHLVVLLKAPAGSEDRAQAYSKALLMYRGPFAELFYSEWAESLRHRIESRSLEAISVLAGFHAGQGNFEEAATTLERVLERDEFNEEAIYQVAVYRARAGQGATALRFIDRCRERWQVEYKEEMPQRFSFLRASIASGKAV